MTPKRLVVTGFMAGMPIAGVIWQHLHYLVGLQRLGHEVYYVEDSARYPYDPVAYQPTADYSYAAKTLARLAADYGFRDRWAYGARYLPEPEFAGLSHAKVRELYRTADAVLNVCGAQEFNDDLLASERLLYLESDPGVEQIKIDNGDAEAAAYLRRHHALFTFGEAIGTPEFPVPLHDFRWHPTRQPVVTDFWKSDAPPPAGAVFTSIANWNTSGKKDIAWRGDTYLWSKSLEFLKVVEAPAHCGEPFELATTIRDAATREQFTGNGWRLADPEPLSMDWDLYRRYLQGSKGEFTAAKDQYVRLRTGWFSDRTACYLAAGRPVITQESGFTRHYGGHAGLLAYRTPDEIPELVRQINADYPAHSRAAYEIAAEHFEATTVLRRVLEQAGI